MGTQRDDTQFKMGSPGTVSQLNDVQTEIIKLSWKRENMVYTGTYRYIKENGYVLTIHIKELCSLY